MTKKIRLKYAGPLLDPSGYGQAARGYIQSILKHPDLFDLRTQHWNFEPKDPLTYGAIGPKIKELSEKESWYDTVFIHCVPNKVHRRKEEGKFMIGMNVWETDRLPPHWVSNINSTFDVQIVPSVYNKEVYKNSGVHIPIEVVPHTLDVEYINSIQPIIHPGQINDKFKIMTVLQWTERKNWSGLLKAYYRAFHGHTDTVLILKSYRSNTSKEQQDIIRMDIENLKISMKMENYPPIYFIGDLISTEELFSLMKGSDIFFLIPRSEGFGLPIAEAAACGLPVISSMYGSIPEVTPQYEYLVECMDTPVCGMPWIPNYDGTQTWGEPNIMHAVTFLRELYDMKVNGKYGLEFLSKESSAHAQLFAPKRIGQIFYNAILKHMK